MKKKQNFTQQDKLTRFASFAVVFLFNPVRNGAPPPSHHRHPRPTKTRCYNSLNRAPALPSSLFCPYTFAFSYIFFFACTCSISNPVKLYMKYHSPTCLSRLNFFSRFRLRFTRLQPPKPVGVCVCVFVMRVGVWFLFFSFC